MATLLVSDTSVLIDLQRGGFLEALFRLPYDVGVPDVLFEREIKDWVNPALQPLGLQILVLDGDGVALAQRYRADERRLSLPDAFALALAKVGGHTLLAGDSSLRSLGEEEGVACHGVLWVLDELERIGLATSEELASGLTAIAGHPRCRLPKTEIQARLKRYRDAGPTE
jgi:hypothetical protein